MLQLARNYQGSKRKFVLNTVHFCNFERYSLNLSETFEVSYESLVDFEVHFCTEGELALIFHTVVAFWVKTLTYTVESKNSFNDQDIFKCTCRHVNFVLR